MSDSNIGLAVQERPVRGKAVKHLRRDGLIPAVIHDHGKESKIVMAPYLEVVKVYQKAGKTAPLELQLGKAKYLAIIKDVDFEPKKHKLRHVVFNAIEQNQTVQTEVPIRLSEDIPAEKAGYMVIRNLDTVEIEALPKDLVDELHVDAGGLEEIGDKLAVADIAVPTGVTILTEAEHTIAVVEETKAQMSEEESTEEAAESDEEGAQESAEEE